MAEETKEDEANGNAKNDRNYINAILRGGGSGISAVVLVLGTIQFYFGDSIKTYVQAQHEISQHTEQLETLRNEVLRRNQLQEQSNILIESLMRASKAAEERGNAAIADRKEQTEKLDTVIKQNEETQREAARAKKQLEFVTSTQNATTLALKNCEENCKLVRK